MQQESCSRMAWQRPRCRAPLVYVQHQLQLQGTCRIQHPVLLQCVICWPGVAVPAVPVVAGQTDQNRQWYCSRTDVHAAGGDLIMWSCFLLNSWSTISTMKLVTGNDLYKLSWSFLKFRTVFFMFYEVFYPDEKSTRGSVTRHHITSLLRLEHQKV